MKKFLIIISAIVLLVIIAYCIYASYSLSPDDYGKQYNKKWISDDGRISFVTNNKKGLFDADFNCYDGVYKKDKNTKYKICMEFDGNCNITVYKNGELTTISVALGDYNYNFITKTLELKVTLVDFKDSVYKVGDNITFHCVE